MDDKIFALIILVMLMIIIRVYGNPYRVSATTLSEIIKIAQDIVSERVGDEEEKQREQQKEKQRNEQEYPKAYL